MKSELETILGMLSGKGKGQKGKALRGAERRKMWEEVKALRKEYVSLLIPYPLVPFIHSTNRDRYRQRENGVVKGVLAGCQVYPFPADLQVCQPIGR